MVRTIHAFLLLALLTTFSPTLAISATIGMSVNCLNYSRASTSTGYIDCASRAPYLQWYYPSASASVSVVSSPFTVSVQAGGGD